MWRSMCVLSEALVLTLLSKHLGDIQENNVNTWGIGINELTLQCWHGLLDALCPADSL